MDLNIPGSLYPFHLFARKHPLKGHAYPHSVVCYSFIQHPYSECHGWRASRGGSLESPSLTSNRRCLMLRWLAYRPETDQGVLVKWIDADKMATHLQGFIETEKFSSYHLECMFGVNVQANPTSKFKVTCEEPKDTVSLRACGFLQDVKPCIKRYLRSDVP